MFRSAEWASEEGSTPGITLGRPTSPKIDVRPTRFNLTGFRCPGPDTVRAESITKIIRSEKLQNESFPNFSIFRPEFCPEFCSEFSPKISRSFRASFRGRRRPEKIHQKSPPFFNVKFPGKHEKNIHKILLESRQSKKSRQKIMSYKCADYPHRNNH